MKILLILVGMLITSCGEVREVKTKTGETSRKFKYASFLPENNWHQREYYAQGEVTEQDFQDVIDALTEIYEPIVAKHGARLNVYGNWADNTVNAYADQQGDNWNVSFFGGLARHPNMTREGFALVGCHEMGHHLGGFPFYLGSWASNEGNSDFFSTASCARKMFHENSPLTYRWSFMKKKNPKPVECGQDDLVCRISLAAGLSLGSVLAELNGEKIPSYETPSKDRVTKTSDKHPKAQCRTDTYKMGALCNKHWNDEVIPQTIEDMRLNSCKERPACWFAP